MSVWRRKAIESFPELRPKLNDRREIPNVYLLWLELRPMWVDAHTDGNDEMLDRIYGYADWCSQQRDKDLWNSTAVCFYEHILDDGGWETVLPRLSDATIVDVWGLWEYFLSEADLAALRKLLHEQKRPVPAPGTGITCTAPTVAETGPALSAKQQSRVRKQSSRRGTRPRRDQRP